jgi:hypothetical protein
MASEAATLYRLGHLVEGEEVEHSHPAVFRLPAETSPSRRIVVGVPGSDPVVLLRLAQCLEDPLYVLYILHTPRGEAEPGRYQSTELSRDDLTDFIEEFRPFLMGDGRFDLWVYSPSQKATIAWDRHNLLYAYGPLDSYEAALHDMGFEPGEPVAPAPHSHHYRPELDPLAARIIERFDWHWTPLRPGDEQ